MPFREWGGGMIKCSGPRTEQESTLSPSGPSLDPQPTPWAIFPQSNTSHHPTVTTLSKSLSSLICVTTTTSFLVSQFHVYLLPIHSPHNSQSALQKEKIGLGVQLSGKVHASLGSIPSNNNNNLKSRNMFLPFPCLKPSNNSPLHFEQDAHSIPRPEVTHNQSAPGPLASPTPPHYASCLSALNSCQVHSPPGAFTIPKILFP